jgi:hypothetical protein
MENRIAMREVIAKRVIETAQRGVEDSHALADDAVHFVMTNYKDNCPIRVAETL